MNIDYFVLIIFVSFRVGSSKDNSEIYSAEAGTHLDVVVADVDVVGVIISFFSVIIANLDGFC
jgi:hypothetical protein